MGMGRCKVPLGTVSSKGRIQKPRSIRRLTCHRGLVGPFRFTNLDIIAEDQIMDCSLAHFRKVDCPPMSDQNKAFSSENLILLWGRSNQGKMAREKCADIGNFS